MSHSIIEAEAPSTQERVQNLERLLSTEAGNTKFEVLEALPVQEDFFTVLSFVSDLAFKDDIASMEHPYFSLSKRPEKRIREYSLGGKTLKVIPSVVGAPTIFDKDLVIFLTSAIVRAQNAGRPVSKKFRIHVTDFLRTTHRSTGGASYQRVVDMCRRLAGARIETNVRSTEEERTKGFGMIEAYEVVSYTKNGKGALELDVTVSDWVMRSAVELSVLTLNSKYFKLTGPVERRLYELARKHCGAQPWWVIDLELLRTKVGSEQAGPKWKQEMKRVSLENILPDYRVYVDESVKPNQAVFLTRDTEMLMDAANKQDKIAWLERILQPRLVK